MLPQGEGKGKAIVCFKDHPLFFWAFKEKWSQPSPVISQQSSHPRDLPGRRWDYSKGCLSSLTILQGLATAPRDPRCPHLLSPLPLPFLTSHWGLWDSSL